MTSGILVSPKANARFVVTMPQEPSKLADALRAHAGFGTMALTDTSDAFRHLARRAIARLVIMMPFIDSSGAEWASEVFSDTEAPERILILRNAEQLNGCGRHGERLGEIATAIREYGGSGAGSDSSIETFHAKIVLADGVAAYVGSANLLRRSRKIQLECGMLIEGPAVQSIKILVDALLATVDLAAGHGVNVG